MPNQTLYDNFSQVRQYIDQEKPDLSSYVTKTELSNCGYLTSVPSEYITQQELSGNSYATTSELSSYLPLSGGTLNGNLTLGNTYFLTVGTQRAWKLFEDGSGRGAYIALQATVDSKSFFIRDVNNNNIIEVFNNNAAANYVKNYNLITYTCNIKPINSNTYTLGSSDSIWTSTYTNNIYSTNIILSYGYNWIKNTSNTQIDFGVNQYNRAKLTNTEFCPSTNNGIKLGTSTNQWDRTYTGYLYLNGTNIIDTINGIFSYDSSTGTLSITTIS